MSEQAQQDVKFKSCPDRLIDFFGGREQRGSVSEAARQLGIDKNNVFYWLERGYIPPGYEPDVERITNGGIKTAEIVAERNRKRTGRRARRFAQVG